MVLDKAAVIHLIGIGGTGLSAIARLLVESGYRVSGSDRALSPLAASLQADGVPVAIGHRAENVRGAALVVRSSAIPDDNVEVQAARAAGIPVHEAGRIPGHADGAVAGDRRGWDAWQDHHHRHDRLDCWLHWVQDPSYIIGGTPANLGVNAHAGRGAALVIEADEYDRMFLGLKPHLAVVTNVEHDHPDCYPTAEDFYQAFAAFSREIQPQGVLLACGDDAGAARLLEEARRGGIQALAYGIEADGAGLPGGKPVGQSAGRFHL